MFVLLNEYDFKQMSSKYSCLLPEIKASLNLDQKRFFLQWAASQGAENHCLHNAQLQIEHQLPQDWGKKREEEVERMEKLEHEEGALKCCLLNTTWALHSRVCGLPAQG